ncbi:MAG: hypothetical protein Q9190_002294 [Brigantiaea leucoxantha]
MPTIHIHNKSGHPQTFEVHGFNNNHNITVPPHHTSNISAGAHDSGAIIALHNGHEGEQAEITFAGFGGNDFFDISNIVGAGGNITIQQVGEPSTRKGDPLFMQNLRHAWDHASSSTKHSLSGSVFTDGKGHVERIGPIKEHPSLENFVRSFADGKTYIGVGAWGGSPGVDSDNQQSSAAKGSKDSLITYNDGDASPETPHHAPHLAHRSPPPHSSMKLVEMSTHAAPHKPEAHKGPGIDLHNRSHKEDKYFFYDNYWNGNGTAGANFDHPLKAVHLHAGASTFVPLPHTFKGRVQRGTLIPATWVEFQLDASNDHHAHGDISLEQGYDGPATIAATDGSGRKNGFEKEILKGAPAGAIVKRSDGERVLGSTMGNWMAGPNEEAARWEEKEVGEKKAYIKGGTGRDDVGSGNQRLRVDFF